MSAADRYNKIKKEFPKVLKECLGIVSNACERLKVSRTWYYEMYKTDPEFKAACDDVTEVVIDFVEDSLYKQIREGNTTACIFYLKTKAKHRGYVERIETTGKDGGPIQTELSESEVKLLARARLNIGERAVAEYKAMEAANGNKRVV